MIKDFINKYGDLSDATIHNVSYSRSVSDDGVVIISLSAYNLLEDYNYELIKLTLFGIRSFRFVEIRDTSNFVINSALIEDQNDEILFDFFAIAYATGLVRDPDSDFAVECKSFEFEVI